MASATSAPPPHRPSSWTRPPFGDRVERQLHGEEGPPFRLVPGGERSPVLEDNPATDGKAQSGPSFLARDERLEDPVEHLGRNAVAGVREDDFAKAAGGDARSHGDVQL